MTTKLHENVFFNRCVSCWEFLPPAVDNLMLASFRVSNAFYLKLICQILHSALIFNNLQRPSESSEYFALLYDVPKFICNVVFTFHYICRLRVT